jgi:hypothetical protein
VGFVLGSAGPTPSQKRAPSVLSGSRTSTREGWVRDGGIFCSIGMTWGNSGALKGRLSSMSTSGTVVSKPFLRRLN